MSKAKDAGAVERGKEIEVPETIRTFGMILKKRDEYEGPFYSGSNGYCTINLAMVAPNEWQAVARFIGITVKPDLTSSSIKAALRNLRGHLRNLAIALDKLGIKPR